MAGLAQSVIGGAIAIGSSIAGAAASKKYNRKARQLLEKQREENKNWYDTKMSEDYTARTDVQNVINRQRELFEEQYKRARASQAVAGGTDESLAMQKAAANDAMAQTMEGVAANASSYKDSVENAYRQQDANLVQQQVDTYKAQAGQSAQAAGQATSAGLNMLGQGVSSMVKKSN